MNLLQILFTACIIQYSLGKCKNRETLCQLSSSNVYFSGSDVDYTLLRGENKYLRCTDIQTKVSCCKLPVLKMIWLKHENNRIINFNQEPRSNIKIVGKKKKPKINGTKLKLKSAKLRDSGKYWCVLQVNETGVELIRKDMSILVHRANESSIPIKTSQQMLYSSRKLALKYGEENTSCILDCSFEAVGKTSLTWRRNGQLLESTQQKLDAKWVSGDYVCTVSNDVGSFSHRFMVHSNITSPSHPIFYPRLGAPIIIMISAALILILIAVVIFGSKIYPKTIKKNKTNKSDSFRQLSDVYSWQKNRNGINMNEQIKEILAEDVYEQITAIDIHPNKLYDDKTPQIIGSGFFGKVYKKILKTDSGEKLVAVKTLKEGFSANDFMYFIEEALLLLKAKGNCNVIRILGVCISNTNSSRVLEPALVMELAAGGNLKNHLQKLAVKMLDETYAVEDELISISLQIANGMIFLGENQILHRDLAARNILVCENKQIKIGDFGLSKDITERGYYRVKNRWDKPAKWTAPEALLFDKYTVSSDIWSYGVLLWEVFSFGEEPYKDVDLRQLCSYLQSGCRLMQPENASNEIYLLMVGCWEWEPYQRITFSQIQTSLYNFQTLETLPATNNYEKMRCNFKKGQKVHVEIHTDRNEPNKDFSTKLDCFTSPASFYEEQNVNMITTDQKLFMARKDSESISWIMQNRSYINYPEYLKRQSDGNSPPRSPLSDSSSNKDSFTDDSCFF